MKKWLWRLIALNLVLTSLWMGRAQAFQRNEGIQASEAMCGLVAGLITGKIVRDAGGNNIFSFLAGLLAGNLAMNYCDDLNNEEKRVIKEIVNDGLNQIQRGTNRKFNEKYDVFIDVKAFGQRTLSDGSVQNCVLFKASVHRENPSEYLGRTRKHYWACGEGQNWQIATHGVRLNSNSSASQIQEASQAYVVTQGSYQNGKLVVEQNPYQTASPQQRQVWKLTELPRQVTDSHLGLRPLKMMTSDFEYGSFAAVTADGRGVRLHFDTRGQFLEKSDEDVAVECGVPETAHICRKLDVKVTLKGVVNGPNADTVIQGTLRFMFKNGDAIVRDARGYWKRIPAVLVPQ